MEDVRVMIHQSIDINTVKQHRLLQALVGALDQGLNVAVVIL
jgi:hypothetical protein